MIDEQLQEQAALYAAGALPAEEREAFELVLAFHGEAREFATGLLEITAAVSVADVGLAGASLPAAMKSRLLERIASTPQAREHGLVVSTPDGCVEWVNRAFTEMCGFTLEEVRGRKLGPLLQGRETDRDTAERMRQAVHRFQPCRETILNYHRNGRPYWVEIAITPIADGAGNPRWLVATERELEQLAA